MDTYHDRTHIKKPIDLKRWLWLALSLGVTVLTFWFLHDISRLHGSGRLLRWNTKYRIIIATMVIFASSMPLLWLTLSRIGRVKGERIKTRRLFRTSTTVAKSMIVCGLTLDIILFMAFNFWFSRRVGDKPPLILVADGTGENGIPNLAVTFWTEDLTVNSISWGTGEFNETESEDIPSRQHAFMLDNLKPGSRYWYRVNQGESHEFSTPRASRDTLNFAVSSDSHYGGNGNRDEVAQRIFYQVSSSERQFDYFFLLGDFVDFGFNDANWKEGMEALSSCATSIPIRPVIGNHDAIFNGIDLYQDYFYPAGMKTQTGFRLWYQVEANGIHLFFLDLEWGTESYSEEQRRWFEDQLSQIPREDWVIVMSHSFYYTSDQFENGDPMYVNLETVDALVPLFEKYDVDLAISGHGHHMELLQKDDVCYALVGALGGELDDTDGYENSYSLWKDDQDFGLLEVSIEDDSATLKFRDSRSNLLKTCTIDR